MSEFYLDQLPRQVPLTALGDVIPLRLANEIRQADLLEARTDDITNLYNRKWLTETLDAITEQRPGGFALAFIDLDDLKKVNDSEGHQAGNDLLIRAAEVLSNCLNYEETGLISASMAHAAVRQSGDEYVLVLDGICTQEQFDHFKMHVGACLRAAKINGSIGGRPHHVGESGIELLSAVDKLMYQDKYQRKQEKFRALPRRKRYSAFLGKALLNYAGMPPPRKP